MVLEIIVCDITKIGSKADVIVNAANESLLGGGGVDGAIHRAAGPLLLAECHTLNGCLPGEAKVTKAYNLDNKYIIHTVGPRYYSDPTPEQTLKNAYLNSLILADSLKLETIAFPSISTGAFAYPIEEAAKIAVKTICEYQAAYLKKAYICIYPYKVDYEIYQKCLEKWYNNKW